MKARLPQDAKDAGIIFYELPGQINYENIDPLIRGIVSRINESNWVFTGESCQGHPDAVDYYIWAGNTRPFLRLIVHSEDAGEMLVCLARASQYSRDGIPHTAGLEIWAGEEKGGWMSFNVYIKATYTYERNIGLDVFRRFADSINI